jgi:hypothetical protein
MMQSARTPAERWDGRKIVGKRIALFRVVGIGLLGGCERKK